MNPIMRTTLDKKMNGVFHTPKESARFLANRVSAHIESSQDLSTLQVYDPMVGSGDLLLAICEELSLLAQEGEQEKFWTALPEVIYGTDIDEMSVETTKRNLALLLSERTGKTFNAGSFCHIIKLDAIDVGAVEKAFPEIFQNESPGFSLIVANPPWEVIKVNDDEFFSIYHPEFRSLDKGQKIEKKAELLSNEPIYHRYNEYVKLIEDKKRYLAENYKISAGHEFNLFRVSLERILQLSEMGGIIGVITSSGLAGENTSVNLRKELLLNNQLLEAWSFSSGAKLFPEADISPLFTISKLLLKKWDSCD